MPHALYKVRSARPWPVLPFLHVTVLNRIVVNIVNAGPKMFMRLYAAVHAVVPHLSSSLIILAVPFEGCAAMKTAELFSEFLKAISLYQEMVMIWQDTPGISICRKLCANFKQQAFILSH